MASDTEGTAGEFIVRAGMALAIHLLLAGLFFALLMLLVADQSVVHPDVIREAQGQDGASIGYALEDARAVLMKWAVWALGIGFACSAVFLFAAQRSKPRIDRETRAQMPLWSALFILSVMAAAILWWMGVEEGGVALLIVAGTYFTCTGIGFLFVVLGYFLTTALCVKATMKPSVPLSAPFPSLKR